MTNRVGELRVLALTRYQDLGASSRYRILQFAGPLEQHGVVTEVHALLDNAYVGAYYAGAPVDKVAVARAYLARIRSLFGSGRFDLVWIEKEALPYIPGWMEALLLRRAPAYVLDYDDAVFHNYDRHRFPVIRATLGRKYDRIMREARLVVAGNDYIAERARDAGAKHVEVVPTVVDTDRYPLAEPDATDEVWVGWIGTPYTSKYLDELAPVLTELGGSEIGFRSIGSGPLKWADDRVEVVQWSEETEGKSLRSLSIGIMPIPDNPFERGKCGLKLIQYMAAGLPVIASPVGVNREIVEPGVNGYLCSTVDEWRDAIRHLAADRDLRRRLGRAGRLKVEQEYSLNAVVARLASLLWGAGSSGRRKSDVNTSGVGRQSGRNQSRVQEYDMARDVRVSAATVEKLRCPVCRATVTMGDAQMTCDNASCGMEYPVVDSVPVLINEATSIFSVSDYVSGRATTFPKRSAMWRRAAELVPDISSNLSAKRNYETLASLLRETPGTPTVLSIGGSIVGRGMEELLADTSIEFVDTDVAFGPRTAVICDAHDLPFEDSSFDAVIAQAVLEHVADPYQCVAEIHRVLKGGGLVYAEVPFMQQVHAGRYDFTRFTHLGLRRLFREFDEEQSGSVAGPGTVMAWSYQHMLLSPFRSTYARAAVKAAARLSGFWLKYLDHLLIDKPGADDAASAFFFLGRKSDTTLSDRDLIKGYRGAG